jgi:hypothetical protein
MDTPITRKCAGSVRFGIEPHDAPIDAFPIQKSQPDGLGRLCAPHWTTYVRELAKARKAGTGGYPAKVDTSLAAGKDRLNEALFGRTRTRKAFGRMVTEEPLPEPVTTEPRKRGRQTATMALDAPTATERPRGETPAVTMRRAAFEARLARVGVGTDEGQAMLEKRSAGQYTGPASDGGGQGPD